jgi:hypothetical protein
MRFTSLARAVNWFYYLSTALPHHNSCRQQYQCTLLGPPRHTVIALFYSMYSSVLCCMQNLCVIEGLYNKLRIEFLFIPQQRYSVLDRLIVEVSISHTDTPHLVGVLWTSGRPDAETST